MIAWSFPAVAQQPEPDARCLGKTLLLVGTCQAKRRHTLERLRALGLARVICLNNEVNWAAPLIDQWILANPAGINEFALNAVKAHLVAHPDCSIDGVLTFDEYNVQTTSRLAEMLGTPGILPASADRARNKLAFREFCSSSGLPAPRYVRLLADPAERSAVNAKEFVLKK